MSIPETPTALPAAPAPRKRKRWIIAGVLAATAIGGVALAQNFHGPGHFGPGMMMHGGGMMMHGGPGPFGAMDPAQMEDRADKAIRHLAIEIDANAEQQEKLRGIARALVKDLAPLRDARQETMRQGRALLTGATIDAGEVEKFRAGQMAKMDAVTKRVSQALVEAAGVLTPEQRRKLDERLPRPGAGPFWRRG